MLMQRETAGAQASGRWLRPDRAALERVVATADPRHAFLRPGWWRASHPDVAIHGYEHGGRLIAAFPLAERRLGPFRLREVAGPYWPFRSVPIAADTDEGALTAMLAGRETRRELGSAWRIGPVPDDDPSVRRLLPRAREAGWAVFERGIADNYTIDVARLAEAGAWPSKSAIRQSRNYANRLARTGEVAFRSVTGESWTAADRDAIAAIEANSWLASIGDTADTKFHDPARRRTWEAVAQDPALAPLVFCTIMAVGGTPAAFTFGIEVGRVRYQIANNFDDRFKECSPGRIVLTRDFENAAARGIATIDWGAGDAGYKARYGAEPDARLIDLLFVDRGWLAALARPLLARQGWSRI